MKKQILYADFMPRLFSTMMDLCFLTILLIPITNFVNRTVIAKKFGHIFASKNVDIYDTKALKEALQSPEFAPYSNIDTVIELMMPMACMQLVAIVLYFIASWYFWSATPIKHLMRMRVVDATTFNRPTFFQLIKRFIGYVLFPIGVWFIFFTKQKQMLHDRISNTVVIKI